MDYVGEGYFGQLDEFLDRPSQMWLFGAGISVNAGIPLMKPLTERVVDLLKNPKKRNNRLPKKQRNLLEKLFKELPDDRHIEHFLSHLSDYAALADRTSAKRITIRRTSYSLCDLKNLHSKTLTYIAETVRWGFRPATNTNAECEGNAENPIVSINEYLDFLDALMLKRREGLDERRPPIQFFTTNYDTLLEDALALKCHPYWDGFSGGAVAFRTHRYGEKVPSGHFRAHVIKLHGSIDWYVDENDQVLRVRDGDKYPKHSGRVLIYPQSTKYLATQRDPFAAQFDIFRRALSSEHDNILAICGYSFGDEHINQEIELALSSPRSKTTVLAFSEAKDALPKVLESWRYSSWGKRLYIVTSKALYVGDKGPFHTKSENQAADNSFPEWWTFKGVTDLLRDGV